MKKAVFICSGNTCRSPMAEGIAKKLIKGFSFCSAGLAVSGNEPVSENAVSVCRNHGIDIKDHIPHGLSVSLCRECDIFVCMTDSHRSVLKRVLEGMNLQKEIYVLSKGIADPYMGDSDTYEKCFHEIKNGIYRLFLNISVSFLSESDSEAIGEIEKECFSSPWSENAVTEHLKSGTAYSLGAYSSDNKVIGYITSSVVENDGEIYNIAVKEQYRKKGIGYILLYEYFDSLPCGTDIVLEVRSSNKNAVKLYEKCGFSLAGKRKDFYTLPREDALIYKKRKDNQPCMY